MQIPSWIETWGSLAFPRISLGEAFRRRPFGHLASAYQYIWLSINVQEKMPRRVLDWKLISSDGGWHKRRKNATVVYQGSIYMIGGFYAGAGTAVNLNDVWKCDDGVNWTRGEWKQRRAAGGSRLLDIFIASLRQCA